MTDLGDGRISHSITAIVIGFAPIIADADLDDPVQRLAFAGCGGLGAILAMIGDRPKVPSEFIIRIAGGIFSTFLFAPWLAKRFGQTDMNGTFLTFGITGAISYFVLSSVTQIMAKAREKNWAIALIGEYMAFRFGVKLPDKPADPKVPGSVTTTTVHIEEKTAPPTPIVILPPGTK